MTTETLKKAVALKNQLDNLEYVQDDIIRELKNLQGRKFVEFENEPVFSDESIERFKADAFKKIADKRAGLAAKFDLI